MYYLIYVININLVPFKSTAANSSKHTDRKKVSESNVGTIIRW